jgi:hypothetical protein
MIKLKWNGQDPSTYSLVVDRSFPMDPYGDGKGPGMNEWYKFLKSLGEFVDVHNKYFLTLPTGAELKTIGNTLQRLRQTYGRLTAYQAHIPAIRTMEMVTRNLSARRKTATKTATINTDINRLICENLFKMWCYHQEEKNLPTGTYDNRLDHDLDREEFDRFDNLRNPGAYYIQSAFREYFDLELDNKQTKDLILATTKSIKLPLSLPIIDEAITAKTFPYIMGWMDD